MPVPPVPGCSPQSTAIITWCYAVTMLRYARISPHYAGVSTILRAIALVYHHTALRSCISTLRAIAHAHPPHCAARVSPHYALSRMRIHHTALLVYHHTTLRLCITPLRCAGVVLIAPAARHMPPAWLLLIPCTSARSTPCAAGTVSATPPFGPTRSSRNGRPDRRRSQRGRSRAWRGSRRQTTAPAG